MFARERLARAMLSWVCPDRVFSPGNERIARLVFVPAQFGLDQLLSPQPERCGEHDSANHEHKKQVAESNKCVRLEDRICHAEAECEQGERCEADYSG